jgi:hypothetical protein
MNASTSNALSAPQAAVTELSDQLLDGVCGGGDEPWYVRAGQAVKGFFSGSVTVNISVQVVSGTGNNVSNGTPKPAPKPAPARKPPAKK